MDTQYEPNFIVIDNKNIDNRINWYERVRLIREVRDKHKINWSYIPTDNEIQIFISRFPPVPIGYQLKKSLQEELYVKTFVLRANNVF